MRILYSRDHSFKEGWLLRIEILLINERKLGIQHYVDTELVCSENYQKLYGCLNGTKYSFY